MRPLFTIHAGEFLVGEYISRALKGKFDVWLPVQDTGVDLLLTPSVPRTKVRPLTLQVKFSRSFPAKIQQPEFLARGWFTLQPTKILKSRADVWIFVVLTMRHDPHFILVPLNELKRRIPRPIPRIWHMYLTIYRGSRAFDTRGLRSQEILACPLRGVKDLRRDYTACLENWSLLTNLRR